MAKNTLTPYLRQYSKIQSDIMLVYHPTRVSTWSDRCLFGSDEYNMSKAYNHRSILSNEVVIEFDDDSPETNKKYADLVHYNLKQDGFKIAKWRSGNKSVHVHFFVNLGNSRNTNLLKKTIMRYYTKGIAVPDLRLASDNHLIRAEYGVHEKTGEFKSLISKMKGYPEVTDLPEAVWSKYMSDQKKSIRNRFSYDLKALEELPGFKYVVNAEQFRATDDGRERALFMLIHVLKPRYKERKAEFIKFLQDWYRYSSGRKLSDWAIKCKVEYHWEKNYSIGVAYLNELLESVGRDDLVQKTL